MATMEKTIDVDVPVRTAYGQWTQFEEFPRFMEGVKQVRQIDDKHLHWQAEIGGREVEWDAEIVEQVPDKRIVWRSLRGKLTTGAVYFDPLGPERTRIRLAMTYEPKGALEGTADLLGIVSMRVKGDLERFKAFIESRGVETGAWRGEVHAGKVER
jgi:uncharacterized membrane protein